MAGITAQVVEVEDGRAITLRCLVAVDTGDRSMPASQRKARLLVTCYVERRVVECVLVVTAFTAIEVWRSGELIVVDVLMAIEALRRLGAEYRRSSRRHMALRAGNIRVFGAQRKVGLAVVGHRELRRLESVKRMARIAAATVGASEELSIVWIGLVAVGACVMRDG